MNLNVTGVSWTVAGHRIVREVSLQAPSGKLVGLIGPNGSGKSSLLRMIYRVLQPDAGTIYLDEENVWEMNARKAARRMAVVLQEYGGEFDFSVREMVLMGRSPHKQLLERDNATDLEIVDHALGLLDMRAFADRSFPTLSGGEKQRVLVARALAQQPRFLVLDEPTNHLDVHYQLELLDLVRGLNVTTIAALHDLNLAALYCDFLYVMKAGHIVASGPPEEVLTPQLISSVYDVNVQVAPHPSTGRLHVVFVPRRSVRSVQPARELEDQGTIARKED